MRLRTGGCSVRWRQIAVLLVAALCLCAAFAPHMAWAYTRVVGTLDVECASEMQLGRIDLAAIPIKVTPASIEVGISCGMTNMCGQDPCLCGAVDDYGVCACNGMRTIRPEVVVTSSDEDVAMPVNIFGDWYLLSMESGTATITVCASLAHYNDMSCDISIEVAPFGALDVVKFVVPLMAVVLVVLLAIRSIARRRASRKDVAGRA